MYKSAQGNSYSLHSKVGQLLAIMYSKVLLLSALVAVVSAGTVKDCGDKAIDVVPKNILPIQIGWSWVNRSAEVLPYKCNFIYGGGSNRMLYVGRVKNGRNILPASIHHYGKAGTETVHSIWNNEIIVEKNVEWLCATSPVGWARVEDLSPKSLIRAGALPVGYNSTSHSLLFACMVHSFYSDTFPPSVGTVIDSNCVFESNKQIVNSKDFNFWHTLEVLVRT